MHNLHVYPWAMYGYLGLPPVRPIGHACITGMCTRGPCTATWACHQSGQGEGVTFRWIFVFVL